MSCLIVYPPNDVDDDRARMRRQRLLARIRRRYEIITTPFAFGPVMLDFVRVADPDRVLDEVAEEVDRREKVFGDRQQESLHLPYWAELWDSAVALGTYLAQTWGQTSVGPAPEGKIHRRSVLDLGCGMGLAGTVAAAMGARVLFADLEAPALLFAQVNSVVWGDRIRTRQLNWQKDRLNETFDVILGADILYERSQWTFLQSFWEAHLRPGGEILLGEPGRQTGDGFIDWIGAKSWQLERLELQVPAREAPVRILRLLRDPSAAVDVHR